MMSLKTCQFDIFVIKHMNLLSIRGQAKVFWTALKTQVTLFVVTFELIALGSLFSPDMAAASFIIAN